MSTVLHVVPSLAPRDGGPSAAVLGMCRALNAAGTPTLIAATDADGPERLDVPVGTPVSFAGTPVRFFARELSARFKSSGSLARWLRAEVAGFAVVHVHAVFSHPSISAGAACRAAGVPYVVRPLGSLDPWSLAHHGGRKKVLMQLGARSLLSGAARMHYTADQEQRRAEGALSWLPPGVVVPLGVDDALFDGVAESDRFNGPVVTLSRLHPKKGIDLVIRAFHQLAPRMPMRKPIIAGDGDTACRGELESLARGGPAAGRIEFRGWVDEAERRQLLQTASLFVLPSLQENFGLSIVEAMAAGTPVIVAREVDLADQIARAAAGWAVARTVDAIVEGIVAALHDPAAHAARSAAARDLAEQYRWPRVAAALDALYRTLEATAASASGPGPVQPSLHL